MSLEFLWYIPNTVEPGHRGDDTTSGWGSIEYSTDLARLAEDHGWSGALLGTGWGRPDTFTVATALAARTTTFKPLIAIRPGYWHPANFASAAGHRLNRRSTSVPHRWEDASDALFRRRVPGRRTGVGGRGGCPALLG